MLLYYYINGYGRRFFYIQQQDIGKCIVREVTAILLAAVDQAAHDLDSS